MPRGSLDFLESRNICHHTHHVFFVLVAVHGIFYLYVHHQDGWGREK